MFGFLVGTACLVGLIWTLGHGRHSGIHHRRFAYRWFDELDMTPAQEKAVRSLLEEFGDAVRQRARTLRQSAEDIGRALRGQTLDESLLTEVFAAHDRLLAELRPMLVELLRRVHELLDDNQRRRLARLIESRPGWICAAHHHARCGCHPGHAACHA